MKIILAGYHWTGCKALECLLSQGHEVFVFTHKSPYPIPDLAAFCRKTNTRWSADNISKAQLPFAPDVIASIYYRHIIKPHVIAACRGRVFNLHPSLLPRYRGCSSLTWAMIHGERQVGYTYHYVDSGVDTGRILIQETVAVEDFDTQQTLYHRVMFEAMKSFPAAMRMVLEGAPGRDQVGEVSHYPRGCPHGGNLDPAWAPEIQERFVRAMIFPPYPVARLHGREIFKAEDLA